MNRVMLMNAVIGGEKMREYTTQMDAARKGIVTPELEKVAEKEKMTVEELQQAILAKMANNGPVTDQMKKTVYDNIWHDSLVNWLKSFR